MLSGCRRAVDDLLFYQGHLVKLFKTLIDRQSWSDDGSVSERMLRNYLLLFACVRRYPSCISTATQLFQQWKESDGKMWWELIWFMYHSHYTHCILFSFIQTCVVCFRLPTDISLVVYTEGARTDEGWDFLLEKYKRSVSPSEKWMIKAALSYTPLTHKLQWWVWIHEAAETSHFHSWPKLDIDDDAWMNCFGVYMIRKSSLICKSMIQFSSFQSCVSVIKTLSH